ncbi:MAG TPA: ribosome small subunit-dependent GTPase A [Clostridia bacterium]|nr:ribosome small subunit-dependent GTPase A [Clostridia bacterium]
MEGKVTKGIGGFYYVADGDSIIECRARKKVKSEQGRILTGDNIEFSIEKHGCVIEKILPRKNKLNRPPVSNVDQAMIVFSVDLPKPNFLFLDKLILNCEMEHLDIFLCCNKVDLDSNAVIAIRKHFLNTGYEIIFSSTKTDIDMAKIQNKLENKTTVLAGPSGVGKSSIINKIEPQMNLLTGNISSKLKRGKHTTRHTELLKTGKNGFVLDTPGFTSLEIEKLDYDEVKEYYSDFLNFSTLCKFKNCNHLNEPGCQIKNQVSVGGISPTRYENYKSIINELKNTGRY